MRLMRRRRRRDRGSRLRAPRPPPACPADRRARRSNRDDRQGASSLRQGPRDREAAQAPYLAQCGVLAGSPHASRLAALPSRLQHAAAELFRGTMVSHSFIAYRDDSADDSQPIMFTGDRWRDYIPIRVPWSVCVRESLPPGSVAVLINQSHFIYRSYLHRRLFRGPAARRHRREPNPRRNTSTCVSGRRW